MIIDWQRRICDKLHMTRNILITGGTTGIGAALANKLGVGETVYITGCRPQTSIAGTRYIAADQSAPEAAAQRILAAFGQDTITQLDLAILNAGIGFWRKPEQETAYEIRRSLDVNLAATMIIAHQLFPLLEAARGKLVLIGSTAHKGHDSLVSYAASKAALDGFVRALRSEWHGRVAVQIIHPGPTNTEMHDKAGLKVGRMKSLFASPDLTAAMIIRATQSGRLRTNLTPLHRLAFALSKGWIG